MLLFIMMFVHGHLHGTGSIALLTMETTREDIAIVHQEHGGLVPWPFGVHGATVAAGFQGVSMEALRCTLDERPQLRAALCAAEAAEKHEVFTEIVTGPDGKPTSRVSSSIERLTCVDDPKLRELGYVHATGGGPCPVCQQLELELPRVQVAKHAGLAAAFAVLKTHRERESQREQAIERESQWEQAILALF
jgi:hypothetical protein